MSCYNCKKELQEHTLVTVHRNIAQPTPIKIFCNEDCKLEWIYKIQKEEGI